MLGSSHEEQLTKIRGREASLEEVIPEPKLKGHVEHQKREISVC